MKTIIRVIAVAAGLMAATSLFAQAASSGTSTTATVPFSNATVESAEKMEDTLRLLGDLGSRSGTGPVLVVPAGEMSIENLAAANEDMNVMSRILASSLKQTGATPYGNPLVGSDVFSTGWSFGSATPNTENIYVQGYGVLFTLKVGFPLSPGLDSNEPEQQPAKAGGDSVWQQARQEMYEPQAERGRRDTARQEKYSAEQVENLKTAVITALKHAANIRGLQPGESVVVTIIGQGSFNNIVRMQTIQGTDDVLVVDRTNRTTLYKGGLPENIKQSAPTVLTIRAKVSDVTAFAKGDLNLDQFRQKVPVLSHPYLGERSGPTSWSSVAVPTVSRRPAATGVRTVKPTQPPQSQP